MNKSLMTMKADFCSTAHAAGVLQCQANGPLAETPRKKLMEKAARLDALNHMIPFAHFPTCPSDPARKRL